MTMVANAALQATDPDLWHVLMAPGETKILSLEQLDDLFRLEIIDADTRVWQPGMREWLPLSVVAGMDGDDEPTVAAAAPTLPRNVPPPHRGPAPPLPPKRTQSGARQAVTQPPTRQTMRAVAPVAQLPQYAATVPAYAQSAYPQPAYPQQPAHAYAQTQPAQDPYANRGNITGQYPVQNYPAPVQQAGAWPPVVASNSAWPASNNSAWPAPAESVRPLAISHRPAPPRPSGGGWGGRFVLTVAFAAGLAVTLYRNDVLRTAASSVGGSSRYMELERSLGGPSFGTPRAVQAMDELEPARSLPTLPVSTTPTTNSAPAPTTTAAAPATPAPSQPAHSESAPAPEKAAPSLATQMAAQLAHEPAAKPAPHHVSATAPVRAAAPARQSAPARKAAASASDDMPKHPIKGSSNAFDPLNGNL